LRWTWITESCSFVGSVGSSPSFGRQNMLGKIRWSCITTRKSPGEWTVPPWVSKKRCPPLKPTQLYSHGWWQGYF
jgi:hypothetical protein